MDILLLDPSSIRDNSFPSSLREDLELSGVSANVEVKLVNKLESQDYWNHDIYLLYDSSNLKEYVEFLAPAHWREVYVISERSAEEIGVDVPVVSKYDDIFSILAGEGNGPSLGDRLRYHRKGRGKTHAQLLVEDNYEGLCHHAPDEIEIVEDTDNMCQYCEFAESVARRNYDISNIEDAVYSPNVMSQSIALLNRMMPLDQRLVRWGKDLPSADLHHWPNAFEKTGKRVFAFDYKTKKLKSYDVPEEPNRQMELF